MTWRLVIFFSLFSLVAGQPQTPAGSTVSGRVELTNSRDPAIRKHKDYSGVVLWLEPAGKAPPLPGISKHVEMDQRGKHFDPHVIAVPLGGTVDFPNHDPFFHNAFSNFSAQQFDIPLYAPGTTRSVTFRHPGIVRVFCNIHSNMSAIIAVVPSIWYKVTDASGAYSIPNVPPGDYQLHIFHERALEENLTFLEHRITVPEAGLTLPLISISETGFVPAPHPDKYGKPYPPVLNDGMYGGSGRSK